MKEKLENKKESVIIKLSDDAMALVTGGKGGEGEYRCPKCPKRFKSMKDLKAHMGNSHG